MKVLLIEDSDTVAATIEAYLSDEPGVQFQFENARDLGSALQLLAKGETDVILLDLGLPDSQGLDTFNRVREHFPDTPTIILTAADDERLARDALRLGAEDYLFKADANGKLLVRSIRYAIERKQSKLRLAESEKKHRTLLEVIPEIVYEIDPEGKFRYVNKSIELLGYGTDELIGQHFSRIVHPEDAENVSRMIVLPKLQGMTTGDDGSPKLFDERRRERRITRDLVLRLVPKAWSAGNDVDCMTGSLTSYGEATVTGLYGTNEGTKELTFIGSVGVIRDITERVEAERKKKALEKQLLQSQKMEAIGRLAGGVAHDMNNVLGAILGSSAVLAMEMEPDSSMRVDLENIQAAGAKGGDLTRDLLGFAQKGKNVNQPFSVNKTVLEVRSLLSRMSLKKVDPVLSLDQDLEYVEGDPGQIQHALMNVCINAVDAIGQRGKLEISTRNVAIRETTNVASFELKPGRYVEIKVSDTGIGMDEHTRLNAFEPFFTTKPEGEGTGLGLSMVYGVVKNHGGSVDIQSAPGEGTTLVIHLPSVSAGERIPSESERTRTVTGRKPRTILVVDDEQIIRNSLKRLLRKLGYEVLLAENGEVAVDIFETRKDEIGLVILDIIMPVMDGPETFKRLIELEPGARVLLLSGYTKDQKVDALLQMGALGFVSKPFDPKAMAELLKKTLS